MKISLIGAGQIGGTLTRRLAQLGHQVFVANSRGPSSLAGLAKETGAKAVTVREAASAGQVVVVTIPEAKSRDLPKGLFVRRALAEAQKERLSQWQASGDSRRRSA